MLITGNLKETKVGICCDRSSHRGNPFILKSEADRDNICDGFKKYLWAILGRGYSPVDAANAIAVSMGLEISTKWRAPTREQFLAAMKQIEEAPDGTQLLCWCHPLRCHCDEYVSYLEWARATIEIEGL
jgi:hypothetical protein